MPDAVPRVPRDPRRAPGSSVLASSASALGHSALGPGLGGAPGGRTHSCRPCNGREATSHAYDSACTALRLTAIGHVSQASIEADRDIFAPYGVMSLVWVVVLGDDDVAVVVDIVVSLTACGALSVRCPIHCTNMR